jgi:putative ABC transport system permease protein
MLRKNKPPVLASFLLSLFMATENEKQRLDDFEEMYYDLLYEKGVVAAYGWYWWQVIISIPGLLLNKIYWSKTMLKSYLKIAFRNMLKYKAHTAIKIFGFALGLSTCIMIYMYVHDEFNYDSFRKDNDKVYRINSEFLRPKSYELMASTQEPLAEALKTKYSQIETIGRIREVGDDIISYNNISFNETGALAMDAETIKLLDIPIISGNAAEGLNRPSTVILTKKLAEKYFGTENPIGKLIKIGTRWSTNSFFEICAVTNDAPDNSFLSYNYIISMKTIEPSNLWDTYLLYTFLKLKDGVNTADFGKEIKNYLSKNNENNIANSGITVNYLLQPIKDIHLFSNATSELLPPGNPLVLKALIILALIILLIAGINYLNLTTSMAFNRAKEVGLRKVVGGNNKQLILQFVSESIALTIISFIIAIFIVILVMPLFNSVIGKDFSMWHIFNSGIFLTVLAAAVITGILSSLYPAIIITSQPLLQGTLSSSNSSRGKNLFGKFLLGFQFSVAFIFIICSFYIYSQVDFMKNANLGFEKEQKMVITFTNRELSNNPEAIKAEFMNIPGIKNISAASNAPSQGTAMRNGFSHQGAPKSQRFRCGIIMVDPDYIPCYKMKIIAGRNFDKTIVSDINGVILSRTAAKKLGYANPQDALNKNVSPFGSQSSCPVIGVIEDYHIQGLQAALEPMAFVYDESSFRRLNFSIETSRTEQVLSLIKNIMKIRFPDKPFEYSFIDERFAAFYASEQKLGNLSTVFSVIGIFISCIGLFGLVSITALQKRKEIGIRKVLGSNESSIIYLLSKSFLKWIVIGNIIAIPISYYLVSKWLDGFAYKTSITLLPFILVFGITLIFGFATMASQTIKAARLNPVESIKYE